jgi:hypothetical protein
MCRYNISFIKKISSGIKKLKIIFCVIAREIIMIKGYDIAKFVIALSSSNLSLSGLGSKHIKAIFYPCIINYPNLLFKKE